jgi:hypothetical protein
MTPDEHRIAERAEMAPKTNAEAYRLAQEAYDMRVRAETAEAARDDALRLVAIASSRVGAFRAQRDEAVAVLAAMLADVDPLLSDVPGSWASMVRARALVEQYRRTTTERAPARR